MTYNPSIPQATDLISVSQGQILTNFGQLNTIFAFDHYTWNDATSANRGLHKKVTFPAVNTDPSLSGAAAELYTKAVAGVTQLFYANASQVTQMTGINSIGSSGSTTVPGGVILKWGSSSFSGTGTALTISFPVAFPNSCFFATAAAVTSTGIAANVMGTSAQSTSAMTVNRAGGSGTVGNMTVYYFAIGN